MESSYSYFNLQERSDSYAKDSRRRSSYSGYFGDSCRNSSSSLGPGHYSTRRASKGREECCRALGRDANAAARIYVASPLMPEYDWNGHLKKKVFFNAVLMHNQTGGVVSNDELEAEQAVVRLVLFPLVVKKGDSSGSGNEEVVIFPAQVLVSSKANSINILSDKSTMSVAWSEISCPG
jgi:hypothetical protein